MPLCCPWGKLGGWVKTQRNEYLKHHMDGYSLVVNEKLIARLEQVGFEWSHHTIADVVHRYTLLVFVQKNSSPNLSPVSLK